MCECLSIRYSLLLWHLTAHHGVSLAQSSQDCPSQPSDKNQKPKPTKHEVCDVLA